ncbi:MAG TPA: tRNA pseudouridine(13) synthase TruD [Tahibacter sp.]|uniref:tRNA pseudouridine(13) synthase TruD n=1 Tax=Tahibacter sp. TaxID=2056211 RepID=UPI002CACFB8E|nr:tRNA pseudouridine(13) synthase TruD [Tahibacter sp.]HSX59058.1 tRNA pseudouridine(13) synthase TruD [Tahibacter sp.]
MSELPFAFGGPPLRARLRAQPEDFFVDEDLGFAPDGAGEHVFVRVEKRGANTDWVARQIARFVGVAPEAVSYAGLKDRHAVTRQTFSVAVPVKRDLAWETLSGDDFRVLDAQRHGRKLKRGALKRNRFRIVLRDVQGDRTGAEARLAAIFARGVPNYFGEQRFGRDGDNVARAQAMFDGRRVSRHERSLLLSAARSQVFNEVLAARVRRGDWDRALPGDVWMLDGSHSIFGPEAATPELAGRLARGDIHPTGPLWGAGPLRSADAVAVLERDAASAHGDLARGLEAAGLAQERRSLRLVAQEPGFAWDGDALVVSFALPAGSYATTLLREVADSGTADAAEPVQE